MSRGKQRSKTKKITPSAEVIYIYIYTKHISNKLDLNIYIYKLTFIRDLLDRGFTPFFCYTDSRYDLKPKVPIKQGKRCAYKDIPLRQYSCHKT